MMNRIKRGISACLAAVMIAGCTTGVAFAETKTFPDVPETSWFYTYVTYLNEQGIIGGDDLGNFNPDSPTTAGEALKLIIMAAGNPTQAATGTHWASGFYDFAIKKGYLAAGDISTNLDAPIRRDKIAKIAAKALVVTAKGTTPFVDADDTYATALFECGILTGSRNEKNERVFLPADSIKRSEISAIIYRMATTNVHEGQISYAGKWYDIIDGLAVNGYDKTAFATDENGRMTYSALPIYRGVDVSSYQGTVDWNAVAADGIDYAYIRLGMRYYGKTGRGGQLDTDTHYAANIDGAKAAGLATGVYFYSCSISVDEAIEEANYVLEQLAGRTVEYPIVYDWELGSSTSRNYNLDTKTLNACALAFCETIENAGYKTVIYVNKHVGYTRYDLSAISKYDIWLAEYGVPAPTYYYDFKMWQYTDSGKVSGISGKTDMNISFVDYSANNG